MEVKSETGYYNATDHTGTSPNYPSTVTSQAEAIIGDVYEPYGSGRWHYKPCIVVSKLVEQILVPAHHTCEPGDDCSMTLSGSWYPGSYLGVDVDFTPLSEVLPWFDIPVQQKSRMAGRIESRLPTLRAPTDAIVFLSELGDISTLAGLSRKRGLDLLANGHLGYSFGVAPLKGDVLGLMRALVSARNRIQSLRKGAGRIHSFTTRFSWENEPSDPSQGHFLRFTNASHRCGRVAGNANCITAWKQVTEKHTLSASVKYRYEFPPELFEGEQQIGGMIAALGFMPNMSTIWEKIPFSFVLDWFFNTEAVFKKFQLDRLGYELVTEIIDFCLAHKTVHEVLCTYEDMRMNYRAPMGREVLTVYDRLTGEDAWQQLSWWIRPPTFVQMALGASLSYVLGR